MISFFIIIRMSPAMLIGVLIRLGPGCSYIYIYILLKNYFFFIFFLSIWSKGRILYIVLISYVKLFQDFLAIQYQYRIETRFSHPLHRIYNRQRYQDYFDNRKDEKNLVTAGANILKVFQLLPESAKVLGDP